MVHKLLGFIGVYFLIIVSVASQTLTLKECHEAVRNNYPAIKKLDLIQRSTEDDLKNVTKGFLPQITFSGQATYQSQTTSFKEALGNIAADIPLPTLSKDQYRIQGEVSQLLYDAGHTRAQKELLHAGNLLQKQGIVNDLYTLDSKVNAIYFSILLMEAQLKVNDANLKSLETQIEKTKAALANGVAYKSNLEELQAEAVSIEMTAIQYKTSRTAYLKMLSTYMGQNLSDETQLLAPVSNLIDTTINRPELKTFELQKNLYDLQTKQLKNSYLPTVQAFFQGAYGRPTLNIIDNEAGPWYLTGVRFSWPLGSLYTLSNDKDKLQASKQMTDLDKATFLLNSHIALTEQQQNVNKYLELIQKDDQMIALRSDLTRSAEAQLANGVITTHEYIQKLQAERAARQTKAMHQIQLLQARYEQQYITGHQ